MTTQFAVGRNKTAQVVRKQLNISQIWRWHPVSLTFAKAKKGDKLAILFHSTLQDCAISKVCHLNACSFHKHIDDVWKD